MNILNIYISTEKNSSIFMNSFSNKNNNSKNNEKINSNLSPEKK